jgi:hypothetical protein
MSMTLHANIKMYFMRGASFTRRRYLANYGVVVGPAVGIVVCVGVGIGVNVGIGVGVVLGPPGPGLDEGPPAGGAAGTPGTAADLLPPSHAASIAESTNPTNNAASQCDAGMHVI